MKKISLELQQCGQYQGGIGTFAYEIAKRITKYGAFEYYGNYFNFLQRKDAASMFRELGFPVRENALMPYGVFRRMWDVCPFYYETFFGEKTDLSVFFNFIVPPRMHGKALTFVHDLTYIRYPETMKRSNYRYMSKEVQRSVRESELVLTTSNFTKKEVRELLDVPGERIKVVYAAPSLAEEAADYETVKRKYGTGDAYILFVSTIEPRKNISRLIRAFDAVKMRGGFPHKLILAGGSGWSNDEIYETARNSAYRKDIVFTGYISGEEKNALYQHASMLVFPSLYEGFGMPPLEAMSWDCPVVCSNVASLPEIAGDAACFVDPFDEDSIADGIIRVLKEKEYAKDLAKKGREQIRRFSWDASAEALVNICREVLC
ncbi:glycosyltransferase family 1 protein [uncultured Oscillibacter sp.]|uniref:glycosyltransferase family 4 protein n=1 Tax=uncultured Oscillibacter sp. TaxID=876091 RepID=UPI0025F4F314|nr:glycosyltransferase family 1 protein [uncultured Oscillibacter sp.]